MTISKTAATRAASQAATAKAVAMFTDGADLATIGDNLGLSVKSVAARLSRAGVYHACRTAGKRNGIKKADIVDRLVDNAPTLASHADDLERLTRSTLEALLATLNP